MIVKENIPEENIDLIKVHIIGAVKNPGIVEIEENSRITDVIEKAGGILEDGDISRVNLAYKIEDGDKIYIPSIHEKEANEIVSKDAGEGIIETFTFKNNDKININTATQTELELLPGIGASTALKIIRYREQNGKFKTIEDIKNVSGIGDAKFENIKDKITAK